MSDTSTIRIPANLDESIEVVGGYSVWDQAPVYCAGVDRDNPDEFCLAFYAEQGSNSIEKNYRASMMAEVINPGEPSTVMGDVLMVADADLCQRVVDNDQEFQVHKRSVQAFRSWMNDYAQANNVEAAIVFEAVHSYAVHIYDEIAKNVERDAAEHIAGLLGLDPSQVGVIRL